ncbi:MAG: Ig-like domain-containing protein, partial [Clostridiales bacterium]|nr:Ig-like domain-containing protein [Clostridiales bacterium]
TAIQPQNIGIANLDLTNYIVYIRTPYPDNPPPINNPYVYTYMYSVEQYSKPGFSPIISDGYANPGRRQPPVMSSTGSPPLSYALTIVAPKVVDPVRRRVGDPAELIYNIPEVIAAANNVGITITELQSAFFEAKPEGLVIDLEKKVQYASVGTYDVMISANGKWVVIQFIITPSLNSTPPPEPAPMPAPAPAPESDSASIASANSSTEQSQPAQVIPPSIATVQTPEQAQTPAQIPEQTTVATLPPQPFIRAYGYNPAPAEVLPAASSAKTLKLRGAATVVLGSKLNLVPLLSPGNYDLAGLVWGSSKPDIATVDGNGVVSGLKAGKTSISVSIPGTKLKASCGVTVMAAPKTPLISIALSSSALALEAGKTATLKATFNPANATLKGLSWVSNNNAIATVDMSGKVSALAAGNATISAISDNGGLLANCVVTVTPKPIKVTGIKLSNSSLSMLVGEKVVLNYTIAPQNATNTNVSWSSSNATIVTVVNGQLSALKKGVATITVITEDGKKKSTCKVTVK